MKKLSFLSLFLPLCLLLASCGSDVYYEKIHTLDKECWNKQDSLVCVLNVEDTLQFYTIMLDVRNSVNYRYQNLYLFMDTKDPRGVVTRDTMEFTLADAHGNWYGRGDRLKDFQCYWYPKVRFPNKGEYRFTFYQAMREDVLKGIANFGMTVKAFDEKKFRKEQEKRRKYAKKISES